jgi:ubiquinone/menaquinone biosynthesis C-methylase UbiE
MAVSDKRLNSANSVVTHSCQRDWRATIRWQNQLQEGDEVVGAISSSSRLAGIVGSGLDVAQTALAIARAKADSRGIEVEFAAADAFELKRLGRRFETVLDCGLFHTFDRDERCQWGV